MPTAKHQDSFHAAQWGLSVGITRTINYIVCTAPRTGSTLLCSALAQTGVAGRPAEYFDIHAHNEKFWIEQLSIKNDADYLTKVIEAGTTDNGVFGFKLHWHQATSLRAKLLADRQAIEPDPLEVGPVDDRLHDLLTERLGPIRYIWLRRRNLVAQAISYYKASVTEMWRAPVQGGDAPPSKTASFDYDAIQRHGLAVEQSDRAWFAYFMRRKLPALIVIYEDFIQTYEKTVRGVLNYLSLNDPALQIPGPQFRQQADAESVEWERRFRHIRKQGPEPRYTPARANRPTSAKRKLAAHSQPELPLIAYDLSSGIELPLDTAAPNRAWMDETAGRFAYRCLPLVIANQAGWLIRNSHPLTAEWDGSAAKEGVRITYDGAAPAKSYASSHFGSGILTFSLGYLFRTSPGYNLWVRGPTNWPKDGICALDGIVETDWTHTTFTMNWKLTRPGHPVTFAAGEPIAMIVPVARGESERFRPQVQPLSADPEWHAGYTAWSNLRTTFNEALSNRMPQAVAANWQRHYTLGLNVGEQPAPEHQTALTLTPFADKRLTET